MSGKKRSRTRKSSKAKQSVEEREHRAGVSGESLQSDRTYDPARFREGAEASGAARGTDFGSSGRGDDLVYGSGWQSGSGLERVDPSLDRVDQVGLQASEPPIAKTASEPQIESANESTSSQTPPLLRPLSAILGLAALGSLAYVVGRKFRSRRRTLDQELNSDEQEITPSWITAESMSPV